MIKVDRIEAVFTAIVEGVLFAALGIREINHGGWWVLLGVVALVCSGVSFYRAWSWSKQPEIEQ